MKKLSSILRYKLTLVILALLFSYVQISAQDSALRIGINLGVNMSNATIKQINNVIGSTSSRAGYQIGVTGDYAVSRKFLIMSGLSFIAKETKYEGEPLDIFSLFSPSYITYSKYKFEYYYFQMPIYGAYKIHLSNDLIFKLGIGPSISYLAGGELGCIAYFSNETQSSYKFRIVDDFNLFDFGLGALLNIEYRNINLNIGYEQGLNNIKKFDTYSYHSTCFTLSLGYKFGKMR